MAKKCKMGKMAMAMMVHPSMKEEIKESAHRIVSPKKKKAPKKSHR